MVNYVVSVGNNRTQRGSLVAGSTATKNQYCSSVVIAVSSGATWPGVASLIGAVPVSSTLS